MTPQPLLSAPKAEPVSQAELLKPKPAGELRAAALVNHYNYGKYVGAAVDSALAQTRPLHEVVVVDDGSDPAERNILREICRGQDNVELVEKENGGQLSCFQTGLDHLDSDVVFFLDADDEWEPDYVERVMQIYRERPDIGFVACSQRLMFSDGSTAALPGRTRDIGFSQVRTYGGSGTYLGKPTSCISVRRSILDRIFPLEGFVGWRICADQALVYGSSIVGARKYMLGDPLVRYRVHGANHWYGRPYLPEDRLGRRIERERLIEHLRRKLGLPACLASLAHHEFRTNAEPSKVDFREYRRLVSRSTLDAARKRRVLFGLYAWYYLRRYW
jgi:glycosyltransferase involved in cell wall biosynthesis